LYPEVRIAIVQGTPRTEDPRTAADRSEAAMLRRFGAELFKVGIATVVVLPSTVPEISERSIEEVGKIFQRRKSDQSHWLKAIRHAQEMLAERGHSDPESALEIAFDVCLYMEDGFRLRIL